jgi:hypothetical protein
MGSKNQGSRNTTDHAAFVRHNTVEKFGVKITSRQREYYRYTDVSAEVERHGSGSRTPDFERLPERDRHDSR